MHGTCIQDTVYMCCVQVPNHPTGIRRWWVEQHSKGPLDVMVLPQTALTTVILSVTVVSYVELALFIEEVESKSGTQGRVRDISMFKQEMVTHNIRKR